MFVISVPTAEQYGDQVTILRWLVGEGELVKSNMPVVELESGGESVTLCAEADREGFLLACLAPEGSVVPVGYVLCAIGSDHERPQLKKLREQNRSLLALQADSRTVEIGSAESDELRRLLATSPESIDATPEARALALELGVLLIKVAQEYPDVTPLQEAQVRAYWEAHRS